MSEKFIKLTKNDFDNFITSNDAIVLFHKNLCPHCKVMETVLEKVLAKDASIKVALVNSEEEQELMEKCKAERVPTLIVFKAGLQKAIKTGVMNPKETLAFYNQA